MTKSKLVLETKQINNIPNWQDKIKAIKDDLERMTYTKLICTPHLLL